jgi:hypothetical protein
MIICTVLLLLIAMTVHSMAALNAEETTVSETRETSSLHAAYTGSVYRSDRRADEVDEIHAEIADRPDSGVPDLFTRELMRCARSDCWSRRGSGDAGVMSIVLPPPPPKVR